MAPTPPPFTIDHDLANRFSHVTLVGFWSRADLEDFRTAVVESVAAAFRSGGGAHGRILVIADRFSLQEKTIAAELATFMTQFGHQTEKIAIVGSDSSLQRLQLGRFAADKGATFRSEDDARRWLFG